MEFQRCNGDMAAHRVAVDDRPARLTDLSQEERTEREEVIDDQVGLILARPVAGRDPRVPPRT
jgi:hypothetical protein